MRRVLFVVVTLSTLLYGLSWMQARRESANAAHVPSLSAYGAQSVGDGLIRRVSDNPLKRALGGNRARNTASDSLSEAEVLRRMGRIYAIQSSILRARAKGDEDRVEDLLESAVRDVSVLMRQPGITSDVRFRELYRTVLSEYERHFGAPSDTLALPGGDIFGFRDSLFTALNELDGPLLEDIAMPELRPAQAVVPMTMNRLVESSIAYLKRTPDRHLHTWLSRADTYFPMIEQILREEGVPDELKYLALVESGLNPRARSWVGAAGMWQFMAPTGRSYGLQANAWMDERLDPEKATRAAARYLKYLHGLYDDWHLALASYNCGPGNVNKAIRRFRHTSSAQPTFWNIYPYLPRETRNYVPMFIATALVSSDPQAFGVSPHKPGPAFEYDLVPVPALTPIGTIAELAGTSADAIRALNPELRRSTVPPVKDAYRVRIPLGTYEQFAAQATRLADDSQESNTAYVVRRGDTLGRIARRYGLTTAMLMDVNGLNSTRLRSGQQLHVPVEGTASPLKPIHLADAEPVRVRYGMRSLRPLTAIAPPRELASARAAQKETRPETKASPGKATAAVAKQEADGAEKRQTVYVVRRGDTLSKIGRRHGVSVSDLRRWNGLRSTRLQVGQRLHVHGSAGPATARVDNSSNTRKVYTVRRGDTLGKIARRHGVSVRELQRWNGLRSTNIRAGQRLRIYT